MNKLEMAVQLTRILTLFPILAIAWGQWKHRKQNGIVAKVRMFTILIAVTSAVYIATGLIVHGMILRGMDLHRPCVTVPLLCVYSFTCLLAHGTWFAYHKLQNGNGK